MSDMMRFEGWDVETTDPTEPRVRDLEIAERAGLARPRTIRDVIRANAVELAEHGPLRRHRRQNAELQGKGRASEEYWLNEDQAVALVAMLRTDVAKKLRVMLVKLFGAYRRGQLVASTVAAAPLQARIGDDVRAASVVRTYCQLASRQTGLSIQRIQGMIRRPWGVMSIYRIALSSLDHTIAQLVAMIEAPRPRRLPADRRQLDMWKSN